MSKSYSGSDISRVEIIISLQVQDDNEEHHAGKQKVVGDVKIDGFKKRLVEGPVYLGAGRSTKWTWKDIYDAIGNANMSSILQDILNEFSKNKIGVDLSQ